MQNELSYESVRLAIKTIAQGDTLKPVRGAGNRSGIRDFARRFAADTGGNANTAFVVICGTGISVPMLLKLADYAGQPVEWIKAAGRTATFKRIR